MKAILIVDDLASVRFYHQLLLNRTGFETFTAADGVEALQVLGTKRIDLVVLDMVMPRMTGAEFLAQARAIPRCDGLPALIISSEADKEEVRTLKEGGVCEILPKPVLPDTLLAAVQRLLG